MPETVTMAYAGRRWNEDKHYIAHAWAEFPLEGKYTDSTNLRFYKKQLISGVAIGHVFTFTYDEDGKQIYTRGGPEVEPVYAGKVEDDPERISEWRSEDIAASIQQDLYRQRTKNVIDKTELEEALDLIHAHYSRFRSYSSRAAFVAHVIERTTYGRLT